MWGWIISIGLIFLGWAAVGESSKVIEVFSDGSTKTRRDDNGGCFIMLIGFVWLGFKLYDLGVKIYNMFL